VLLVEDNDVACRGLARILEVWGFDVMMRHDGHSALEALAALPPPDFVLTDLRLPDLDGREIARQAQHLVPAPRVALITGWDLETGDDEVKSWGIDWVFPKPLDVHGLLARLREPRVER
jgi:DNA-binding response OmpR family regulator